MTENEYIEKLEAWEITLVDIPEEDRTERICLEAVKKTGFAIRYITNPTEQMCLEAVKNNCFAIQYITNPTEEMCLEAVKQDGWAIAYIENPSEAVCLEAVKQNVWLIEYIENPSEAVCVEIVRNNVDAMKYVTHPTEAVYIELVKQEPYRIADIENPSEAVCLEAVKKDGEALRYIKEPSETVCLEAVKQDGTALRYIKEPSETVCLEAVKQNGFAIQYIKEPSEELCLIAVKQNGLLIEYIKNPSEAVCLEAVKQEGKALKYIKEPSEELCLIAVKQNGFAIRYIKNQSEELCLIAVKQDGFAIRYIKDQSEKLCLEAIKENPEAIRVINNPSDKLCLEAVCLDVNAIVFIPDNRRTLEIMMVVEKAKNPDITEIEVIEICKKEHPYALFNSGKEEYVFEAILEAISYKPEQRRLEESKILDKLRHIAESDRQYLQLVIENSLGDPWADDMVSLDCEYFSSIDRYAINNAIEFEEKLGYIPEVEVAYKWKNSVEEYDKKEHERLLEAGVIRKSGNYREEEHKTWILKMYQLFGYENALKMLEAIPKLTEKMEQELLLKDASIYTEVFEKKYILTGEMSVTVELINKINSIAEKDAIKIFKDLNILLEQGNITSIKDVLLKYNLNEKEIAKILKDISLGINKEKIEKIEGVLQFSVNENIRQQRGRIHDLILKVIKNKIEKEEEIAEEVLEKSVIEELNRKEETGEYVYSSVIRREEENIKQTVKQFLQGNGIQEILNNNIIKILKRSKDKIGQGWIRKFIGISLEMTKEEYEKACEMLGIKELEHEKEIRLKGKDDETKEKAQDLLLSLECPELITFEKMEVMFGGLKSPYSKEFAKYFIKHKVEIMSNPEYMGNFAIMHNKFEIIISNPRIKNAYEKGKLTVQKVLDIASQKQLPHIKEEAELAKIALESPFDEMYWEDARNIYKMTREREETTIPPTKVIGKKFKGRMLRVDDPLQLFVGNITFCCQRFGDVGEGAMLHAVTEKNGGIFVIERIDEKGNVVELVAQSWIWRNDDVMCFDNIEVKGDNLTKEEQEEVLKIYQDAANKAIEIDTKALKEMLKQGKITKEQYEYYTLKEVRIGLGYNQGMSVIDEKIANGEVEKSYDVVRPKEADKKYKGTNGELKRPWIDSEFSIVIARNDKLIRKPKPNNEKGEVPVTYSKPREIREEQGLNIDENMIELIKQIEGDVYRKEQQLMKDCTTVDDVAYAYNCDTEKLKVCVSRDKDWYAMYYEEGNSIYIADVALVNGTNAEGKGSRKTETLISSLELAKKMYEVFIEAAESGKTITCDATKDTSGLNIQNMIKNGLIKVIKAEEYDWDSVSNIEMQKMELKPNKEKIEKELKKLEKLIEKAEERRMVYKKADIGVEER